MGRPVTIFQAGTQISGHVEGAEDVEILGGLRGSIRLDGALFVDKAARVQADVEVTRLEIHGVVVGTVLASQSVELFPDARVIGDLTAPRVVIHDGALYRGAIDMGEIDESDSSRGGGNARRAPARPAPPQRTPPPRTNRPTTPAPAPTPEVTSKPAAPAQPAPQKAEKPKSKKGK